MGTDYELEAIKENLALQRTLIYISWTGIIGVALLLFQLNNPRTSTLIMLSLILAIFLSIEVWGIYHHTMGEIKIMDLKKLVEQEGTEAEPEN